MADTLTSEQRHRCMSSVKGRDTQPELQLRKALWGKGLRYRLRYPLPGKPDLVFVRARVAVFVDGCFWHGCPVHGTIPETNRVFWERKVGNNMKRDSLITGKLNEMGWRVIRVWTHEIKNDLGHVVEMIVNVVKQASLGWPDTGSPTTHRNGG